MIKWIIIGVGVVAFIALMIWGVNENLRSTAINNYNDIIIQLDSTDRGHIIYKYNSEGGEHFFIEDEWLDDKNIYLIKVIDENRVLIEAIQPLDSRFTQIAILDIPSRTIHPIGHLPAYVRTLDTSWNLHENLILSWAETTSEHPDGEQKYYITIDTTDTNGNYISDRCE